MTDTQDTKGNADISSANETSIPEDIFGRERIAEQMCQLIVDMKAEAISPLALDGKWGSGKSVHAERMKKCFEDKHADKIKCIYWNASAEDYTNEPILALIATLYHEIREDKKRDEYVKQALALITGFLVGGCIALGEQYINIQTGGLYNRIKSDNKLTRAINSAKLLFNKTKKQENNLEQILKSFSTEKERILAAKEIINIVRGEKELIIIIDELDRCRPDFALKMLESIKHLFATENCKFVLVMNKESMASSVEHLYGLKDEAAKCYLAKYIKKDFLLPSAIDTNRQKISCTKVYFYDQLNKDCEKAWNGNPLLDELITRIIEVHKIQLREIEKLVSAIKFIQEAASKLENDIRNVYFDCISFFIAYLLTFKQETLQKITAGEADTDLILSTLERDDSQSSSFSSTDCFKFIKAVLDVYFSKNGRYNERIERSLNNTNIDFASVIYSRRVFEKWLNYAVFLT